MTDYRNLPLLAGVTNEDAHRIDTESRLVRADTGDVLFPAFQPTRAFWILVEGQWRVTCLVSGDAHVMFEADRPGTWTGGIPMIDVIAPPMAEVLRSSTFLSVPIETMEGIAGKNPTVSKRLLEALNWGSGHIGGLL